MAIPPEELKRAARSQTEFLWENSSDGHLLVDLDGRFVLVNREVEEKTNFSRKELIGKKFFEVGLLSVASKETVMKNFAGRMMGKTIPPYEIEVLSKFGEKLYYELNATPIMEGGKAIGEYVILRDLTERKKLEATLRKEIGQLKEAVLRNARDSLLEIHSLQSFLSDLEKKCANPESEKLRQGIQMADELEVLVRDLVEKMSK